MLLLVRGSIISCSLHVGELTHNCPKDLTIHMTLGQGLVSPTAHPMGGAAARVRSTNHGRKLTSEKFSYCVFPVTFSMITLHFPTSCATISDTVSVILLIL